MNCLEEFDSRKIEIFSSLLLVLPELISNLQVTIAKHHQIKLLLPALFKDVTVVDHVVAIG